MKLTRRDVLKLLAGASAFSLSSGEVKADKPPVTVNLPKLEAGHPEIVDFAELYNSIVNRVCESATLQKTLPENKSIEINL